MITRIDPEDLLVQYDIPLRDPKAIEGVFRTPSSIKKIYIPPGEYELTRMLTVTEPVIIEGEGAGISTLIYNGVGPAIVLVYTASDPTGSGIQNLTIKTTSPQVTTSGVRVDRGELFFVRNAEFIGFNQSSGYGLRAQNSTTNLRLENINFKNNSIGLILNKVYGCSCNNLSLNNLNGNLLLQDSTNFNWQGGKNQGDPLNYGIKIEDGYNISFDSIDHDLERSGIFSIETSGYNRNVSVTNCSFFTLDPPRDYVRLSGVDFGCLSNNYFDLDSGDTAVEITNSNNVTVDTQKDVYRGSNYINNTDSSGIIWPSATLEGTNENAGSTEDFSSARVIDVTKDLVSLGYAANAVAGVAGGGDPIQDAIDHCIKNEEYNEIWIPRGTYLTTTSLIVSGGGANGKPTFVNITMKGDGSAYTDYPRATAIKLTGNNSSDLPVLIQQGGKGCRYIDLVFQSEGNPAPYDTVIAHGVNSLWAQNRTDYISAGVRTNRRSPQSIVAVDPFTSNPPDGIDANRYPGLETYYGGVDCPTPAGSSDTEFVRCSFEGAFVGVAMSPPGNASGADGSGPNDEIQNNESSRFIWCWWRNNTTHFSIGQNQCRHIVLQDLHMYNSWCCIDGEVVGPGGNPGVAPEVRGGDINHTHYVMNHSASIAKEWSNIHIESFKSLGKFGTGSSSVHRPFKLTGCTLNFRSPDDSNLPRTPYHFMTWGIVELDTCEIGNLTATPIKFWNANGRLILRNCFVRGNDNNDRIQIGFDNPNLVRIDNIHVRSGGGAVFQDDPTGTWVTKTVGNSSYESSTVTQDPTVLHRGTINVSDTSNLSVGDIITLHGGITYQPEIIHPDQFAYSYLGPIGYISSINDNVSVTIDQLPIDFPFGVAGTFEAFEWVAI